MRGGRLQHADLSPLKLSLQNTLLWRQNTNDDGAFARRRLNELERLKQKLSVRESELQNLQELLLRIRTKGKLVLSTTTLHFLGCIMDTCAPKNQDFADTSVARKNTAQFCHFAPFVHGIGVHVEHSILWRRDTAFLQK